MHLFGLGLISANELQATGKQTKTVESSVRWRRRRSREGVREGRSERERESEASEFNLDDEREREERERCIHYYNRKQKPVFSCYAATSY